MIDKEELERWLATLPKGAQVGIDDGGLMLKTDDDSEAWLEVGGLVHKEA